MSGDRLAKFQENIDACNDQGGVLVFIGADFAQDVLDVAKAALALHDEGVQGITDDGWSLVAYEDVVALSSALARLDSGAAE